MAESFPLGIRSVLGSARFFHVHRDDFSAMSTIVVMFLTIVLAVSTTNQATAAKETLRSIQRAFVFTEDFKIITIDQGLPTQCMGALAVWKNTGTTPAKRVRMRCNLLNFVGGIPDNFDFPDYGLDEGVSTVLGPQTVQSNQAVRIEPWRVEEAANRISNIYVWGWIEYNDYLPGTKRHRTEFCNQLLVNRTPAGHITVGSILHSKHNGMDEDCLKPVQT